MRVRSLPPPFDERARRISVAQLVIVPNSKPTEDTTAACHRRTSSCEA